MFMMWGSCFRLDDTPCKHPSLQLQHFATKNANAGLFEKVTTAHLLVYMQALTPQPLVARQTQTETIAYLSPATVALHTGSSLRLDEQSARLHSWGCVSKTTHNSSVIETFSKTKEAAVMAFSENLQFFVLTTHCTN